MITASYIFYPLLFHRPAGTSRGVLREKQAWFVALTDETERTGIGEVSYIPGLSLADPGEIENHLKRICKEICLGERHPAAAFPDCPGIQFALETAYMDMERNGNRILFPSDFTVGNEGIPINGLIWMGNQAHMREQIKFKIESGFRVLKLKIGNLELQEELQVMKWIRSEYNSVDLEIRLDANGAWTIAEAPDKIDAFSNYHIHSIEQPIRAGQLDEMAVLCAESPIPIALDEELIGISDSSERSEIMKKINPSYIILKPGLLGGFVETEKWIEIAEEAGAGWWVTSALESNIGLNAIAQWTFSLANRIPQGLGTGNLYSNNIPSPLEMVRDKLWYLQEGNWNIAEIIRS